MIPARPDGGRESFLFPVVPAWEMSGGGKTGWGIVLPEWGLRNGMVEREFGGTGLWFHEGAVGWRARMLNGDWSGVGLRRTRDGAAGLSGFREGQAGAGVVMSRQSREQWMADGAVVPADRVVTHFGFFCKRELELEKTIRLPLRFRLGSLEYCNRLEGK